MAQEKSSFEEELGKRIAQYRSENDFSQRQLAKKLNVSQQLIAAYELGKRRIHVKFLMEVAEALHVTVNDLLGIKSSKNKPGPVPKIQQLMAQIQNLPLSKQKTVLDFLDSFIHSKINKSA